MGFGYCDNCEKIIHCGFLNLQKPLNTITAEVILKRKMKYGRHRLYEQDLIFCSKHCATEWFKNQIELL